MKTEDFYLKLVIDVKANAKSYHSVAAALETAGEDIGYEAVESVDEPVQSIKIEKVHVARKKVKKDKGVEVPVPEKQTQEIIDALAFG